MTNKPFVLDDEVKSEETEFHVIGTGLMRTGTMSLKMALEIIYEKECLHMSTFWMKPQIIKRWADAFTTRKSKTEWKELLNDYCAAVDVPSNIFHRELLEVFPNSKLIFTVRDPYTWARSLQMTIHKHMEFYKSWYIRVIYYFKGLQHMAHLTDCCINNTLGRNIDWDDTNDLIRRYNIWLEKITSSIPTEKLLILNISEGWEPICKFLNRPQPSVPFPHVNDKISFERRFTHHKWNIAGQYLIIIGGIFIITLLTSFATN